MKPIEKLSQIKNKRIYNSMIIGITGFMGSGKDTVAQDVPEKGAVKDSFHGTLKDLCASVFGWDRHVRRRYCNK